MGKLTAKEAAIMRMAMYDEGLALRQDMTNTASDIGAAYPRMLYRATTQEDRHVLTVDKNGKDQEVVIRNKFDGLLCDTMIVESADEAEAMAAERWDVSPKAAHGQQEGLVAATTAKDDEIAALRAQLLAAQEVVHEVPDQSRRGPGRPRSAPVEEVEVA